MSALSAAPSVATTSGQLLSVEEHHAPPCGARGCAQPTAVPVVVGGTGAPSNHGGPAPPSPKLSGMAIEPLAPATALDPQRTVGPGPIGFLNILRNVPVRTPVWLTVVRILQFLLALVVIASLAWNLVYFNFDHYHGVTVALLFAASWTLFPTAPLTLPLPRGFRHVVDPRIALLADGLATVLWGMSFAALHAVQWELRGKFWAQAWGPHEAPDAATGRAAAPTGVGKRLLMPHRAYALDARGIRKDATGLASNDDASSAWKMGMLAAYLGAAEFLLFALTTVLFAYHYHSALVADTALRFGDPESPSVTPPDVPAVRIRKEDHHGPIVATGGQTVGRTPEASGGIAAGIARLVHAKAEEAALPPGSTTIAGGGGGGGSAAAAAGKPSNDSGVFGVGGTCTEGTAAPGLAAPTGSLATSRGAEAGFLGGEGRR